MTTLYLMRHSKPMYIDRGEVNIKDSLQVINEKNILSIEGEKLAEKISKMKEFEGLSEVCLE